MLKACRTKQLFVLKEGRQAVFSVIFMRNAEGKDRGHHTDTASQIGLFAKAAQQMQDKQHKGLTITEMGECCPKVKTEQQGRSMSPCGRKTGVVLVCCATGQSSYGQG